MSGHSKWSTIKHKKGAADAKRGRIFTRLIKEITIAARMGGGDPDGNPRLRAAIAGAKTANMPADNIKRAIQRGTGELPGVSYEETSYEGYGPGGIAVMVQVLTDNRNRTTAEIRHIFSKHGGNLGENNCVSWMFDKKGYFVVPSGSAADEKLLEIVLEAGGDDLTHDGESYEIFSSPDAFESVRGALEACKIPISTSEVTMVPRTTVHLEGKKAQQCLSLLEALEEQEDVQKVSANLDIDESEIS